MNLEDLDDCEKEYLNELIKNGHFRVHSDVDSFDWSEKGKSTVISIWACEDTMFDMHTSHIFNLEGLVDEESEGFYLCHDDDELNDKQKLVELFKEKTKLKYNPNPTPLSELI